MAMERMPPTSPAAMRNDHPGHQWLTITSLAALVVNERARAVAATPIASWSPTNFEQCLDAIPKSAEPVWNRPWRLETVITMSPDQWRTVQPLYSTLPLFALDFPCFISSALFES